MVHDGFSWKAILKEIQKCEVVHGSYERKVVIGYNVTYDDNGTLKTVTMTRHPGAYVKIQ